jgi:hypothetical protein
MLKTTRRFFRMLALRYWALMSDGCVHTAFEASSNQAFRGCSASGCCCQNALSAATAVTLTAAV